MKKLILPLMAMVFLCACTHNPPQPYGNEFPLNDMKYYQQQNKEKQ